MKSLPEPYNIPPIELKPFSQEKIVCFDYSIFVKFSAGWGIRRVPSYNRDLKHYRSDATFQALMATVEER
jgi:hypothetical protein